VLKNDQKTEIVGLVRLNFDPYDDRLTRANSFSLTDHLINNAVPYDFGKKAYPGFGLS